MRPCFNIVTSLGIGKNPSNFMNVKDTKDPLFYNFSLRAKNKLLQETKDLESINVALHAGVAIRGFPLAQLNLMHASPLPVSCWLLSHIKVHYINIR